MIPEALDPLDVPRRRFTIELSDDELAALRSLACRERRTPNAQAAVLVVDGINAAGLARLLEARSASNANGAFQPADS